MSDNLDFIAYLCFSAFALWLIWTSLAREAELWIREWAERSEVKLLPKHILVYAELNQTCNNYLFWPNAWYGDYELEFGNGKELS